VQVSNPDRHTDYSDWGLFYLTSSSHSTLYSQVTDGDANKLERNWEKALRSMKSVGRLGYYFMKNVLACTGHLFSADRIVKCMKRRWTANVAWMGNTRNSHANWWVNLLGNVQLEDREGNGFSGHRLCRWELNGASCELWSKVDYWYPVLSHPVQQCLCYYTALSLGFTPNTRRTNVWCLTVMSWNEDRTPDLAYLKQIALLCPLSEHVSIWIVVV
jgi:hypothetical protein